MIEIGKKYIVRVGKYSQTQFAGTTVAVTVIECDRDQLTFIVERQGVQFTVTRNDFIS